MVIWNPPSPTTAQTSASGRATLAYRGEKGKTTGYYVPKAAEEATREGVAAWQQMQQCLRELAELNKERNLQRAREADSQ
jgi:hypothetical protein